MKRIIKLSTLPKSVTRKLNSIARKHGRGKCTGLIIDDDVKHSTVTRNEPFGFMTNSGRFFPNVTTTPYPWNGTYSGSVFELTMPPSEWETLCKRFHIIY
jgi:hypothetical protein